MNQNRGVHVTGIPELTRAFRALDADLYKALRLGMKAIAQHVVGAAEDRGAPTGILRPRASTRGAGIAFPRGGPGSGGERKGFYPWLDFGGGRLAGRGVTANTGGPPRRAIVPDGRFLYPGIAASRDYIERSTYDLIEREARSNGFEVRG